MNSRRLVFIGAAALVLITAALAVMVSPNIQTEDTAAVPTRAALVSVPTQASAEAAAPTVETHAALAEPTATTAPTEAPALPPANTPASLPPSPLPAAVENAAPAAPPPPTDPVPGQAVITFAPDTSAADRAAYIQSLGGTVVQEIEPLNTVVVSLPPETAAQPLPESSAVAATEPDYVVTALQSAPTDPLYPQQWALPVIGAPAGWAALPADAPPVIVAVVDSGICADHPDLAGRVLPGYDFVENDDVPQDVFGHGCSVAGVIAAAHNGVGMAGVAPHARIMPLRVLDDRGLGTYSNVAAAIVHAANNGAHIINLSLGGAYPSDVMEEAVRYAVLRGATVIAAAGNNGGSVLYPAAFEPVVAVASVDPSLQRSAFSSDGPEVDLYAPGRDILVTRPGGTYTTVSGTSFAAPQVAGIAALERAQGRQLALTRGIVVFNAQDAAVVGVTPLPPADGENAVIPDAQWPGGRVPPLRVMIPHPELAAQMAAEATSLADMFPQMEQTGAFVPGPFMVFPESAPWKMLALLVDFSDQPRNASISITSFDTIIFSNTPGVSSVSNYYWEASYNQLDIVSVTLPSALGWVRAPQPMSYYTNGQSCLGSSSSPFSYPNNCQKLAEDLVAAVDGVVDFSQYDNNGDGWVDTVFIIHAGRGAEVSNSVNDIWSHAWGMRYPTYRDGKWVGPYTMQPEYFTNPGDLNIGVLAHELGHGMGLPDLYDIDYSSSGVGRWSLMGGGSWNGAVFYSGTTPANLDAWSKIELKWVTPTTLTTGQTISLPNATSSPTIYRINTGRPGEYFLLENRQKTGYDTYLPAAGLLIWHVDEAVTGPNKNECRSLSNWVCPTQHYRVALEQADGLLDLELRQNEGDARDPFPGSTNNTQFTSTTAPNNSSYYSSVFPLFGIVDISPSSATMSARVTFSPGTPLLAAPASGAAAYDPPALTWQNDVNIVDWQVQVSANSAFTALVRDQWITQTSFAPGTLPDNLYYWRVRGRNAVGTGAWSQVRTFVVDTTPPPVPVLNLPTDGSQTYLQQPTFSWFAADGASRYELQIDPADPSATPEISLTATAYVPPALLDVGVTWLWRVRAIDAVGNASDWSVTRSVTVVSAPWAAPVRNLNATDVIPLSWGRLSWAAAYQVQVSTSPNFIGAQTFDTASGTLSISYSAAAEGIHYWRVRGQYASGAWGPWSAADTFVVDLP